VNTSTDCHKRNKDVLLNRTKMSLDKCVTVIRRTDVKLRLRTAKDKTEMATAKSKTT